MFIKILVGLEQRAIVYEAEEWHDNSKAWTLLLCSGAKQHPLGLGLLSVQWGAPLLHTDARIKESHMKSSKYNSTATRISDMRCAKQRSQKSCRTSGDHRVVRHVSGTLHSLFCTSFPLYKASRLHRLSHLRPRKILSHSRRVLFHLVKSITLIPSYYIRPPRCIGCLLCAPTGIRRWFREGLAHRTLQSRGRAVLYLPYSSASQKSKQNC